MSDDPWAEQAPSDVTIDPVPEADDAPAAPSSASATSATSATSARFPDIAELSYEDARDQLVGVVQRLESGQAPLDETMSLWERGEALADHCGAWLDRAEKRLDEAIARRG